MKVCTNPKLLVDADILIKLSVYDCFPQSILALGHRPSDCATDESMLFSAGLRKQEVRERRAGRGSPAARLLSTLQNTPVIGRLTDAERALSAALVRISQQHSLALDGGEAILVSVSISRGIPYLTTGDKKAIRSLPVLSAQEPRVSQMQRRLERIS